MADYALTLMTLAVLSTLAVVGWRRVRGPARSTVRVAGRIAMAVALGLMLTAGTVYGVSKSRSFQTAGKLVPRSDTEKKLIALTFDDGPEPVYTEQVLEVLKTHDASATFYVVGSQVKRNETQVREIVAAGDELGNHTFDHTRMYFMSDRAIARQIEDTDAALRASGYRGTITFRPPGCKRFVSTPLYLARTGRTTVTWDLEPDSIPAIAGSAEAMTDYVVNNARPGSIVLMHVMYDTGNQSRRALPEILRRLSSKGYRFVTVSQLMAASQRP